MGVAVYSLIWLMQDLYHQPHDTTVLNPKAFNPATLRPKIPRASSQTLNSYFQAHRVVIKWGYTSPIIWLIRIVTLLITPFMTTHEPPSKLP